MFSLISGGQVPARMRLDTAVVEPVNDAGSGSEGARPSLAPFEKSKLLGSGGSTFARMKLKGIDGRAPPGVEPAA